MRLRVAALVGVVATLALHCTAFSPAYSGDVRTDFPASDPSVLVVSGTPGQARWASGSGGESGWEIIDARFGYDEAGDNGYFGV